MEVVKGQVVTSRKGRDVTRAYVVLAHEGERLLLANGGKWTLAAPKPKNPRHIQPTGTVLPEEVYQTDQSLKAALSAYEAERAPKLQGG